MRTLTIYVDESNFEFVTDSVNYEVLNDGLQVTGTGPKPVSHKYSYSGANTLLGYSTSSSAVSPDTNFSVGDTGTIALSNNTIHLYSVQQEPVDITISYKGSTIATMSASGTKTLLTEGKYCEDDITIDYTKPTPELTIYNGAHHSAALISFKIDYKGTITTYGAVNGATWTEWVNSEYNTDGFYVDTSSGSVRAANGLHVDKTLDNPVNPAETIIDDTKYYLGFGPL